MIIFFVINIIHIDYYTFILFTVLENKMTMPVKNILSTFKFYLLIHYCIHILKVSYYTRNNKHNSIVL